MAMTKGFIDVSTEEKGYKAILLDENNIHQVAEDLDAHILYTDGVPQGISILYGLEANFGDFIVKGKTNLLVTDPETFDFFFQD